MYERLLQHFAAMGIAGLVLGSFIEAVGLPFPGGLMLLMGGFMAGRGHWPLYQAGAGAFLGFTAGSLAAFWLGRRFGMTFLRRWGRCLKITPGRLEKTRNWLDRSAAAFIILGRFVPWVSNVTPYVVGLSRIPTGRFLLFNTVYTVLWAVIYLSLGHFLGRQAWPVLDLVKKHLPWAAVLLLAAWVAFLLVRRSRRSV